MIRSIHDRRLHSVGEWGQGHGFLRKGDKRWALPTPHRDQPMLGRQLRLGVPPMAKVGSPGYRAATLTR